MLQRYSRTWNVDVRQADDLYSRKVTTHLPHKRRHVLRPILTAGPQNKRYAESHANPSSGAILGKQVTALNGDPLTTSTPASSSCGTAVANSPGKWSSFRGIPPSTRRSCLASTPSNRIFFGLMW